MLRSPFEEPVEALNDNLSVPTIICFCHLRWDFVFQRPQQLMSRFAHSGPVIYWEEPESQPELTTAELHVRPAEGFPNVTIVTPRLPQRMPEELREPALRRLLEAFAASLPTPVVRWYYTPMMLPYSRGIAAQAVVYDCMDELSAFRFAPAELIELETELLAEADIVFTGGFSLYEAKAGRHPNIHPFPSSVDRAHFGAARGSLAEPADQAGIPAPRLGFYGVLDERLDTGMLAQLADARPDWQLIMVGPVVKIDPADLPRRPNIHYLGAKEYAQLPAYLGGWDVALMPFAINQSTRFISPTKTPEYLAGGRPVVSTRIRDVERHFSRLEAVTIADTPAQFVAACERMLNIGAESPNWLSEVDVMLAGMSWDITQARMKALLGSTMRAGEQRVAERPDLAVAAQ